MQMAQKPPKSIRFPKPLEDKIAKEASDNDRGFGYIVVKICTDHFNRKEK
jgi:hypothetical protein